MSKNDVINVTYRTPVGTEIGSTTAMQNGRTVEYSLDKEQGVLWLVVTEKTRGGTLVREARYLASEVLAIHKVISE